MPSTPHPGCGFFYFGFMREVLGQGTLKTLGELWRPLGHCGLPESRAASLSEVEKERLLSLSHQNGLLGVVFS